MKQVPRLLVASLLLLALAACGGGGNSSPSTITEDPLTTATNDYNNAVENYSSNKNYLLEYIPTAETVLDTIKADDVADSAVLDELWSRIDKAKSAAEWNPPTMETDLEKIQEQTQIIRSQADEMWSFRNSLESAVSEVELSQQTLLEAKKLEGLTLQEPHIGAVSTSNGYQGEYTFAMTNWIKASDTESLQLAWEEVGGIDTVPSVGQFHSTSNDGFTEANAAVAFGKVSFRNVTDGFDITADSPVTFNLAISGENNLRYVMNYLPKVYIQYSDTGRTDDLDYAVTFSPKMTSNSWGPVPFIIVFPDAITPNYPDGNPLLDQFKIYLGGYFSSTSEEYIINPSW